MKISLMKSLVKLQFIITAAFTLILSGCDDDHQHSDKFWVGYGEIAIDGNSHTINLDEGKRLYIMETVVPPYRIVDKQCVVANYTILNTLPEGYNVRLNALSKVAVKVPLYKSRLSENEYEELGDNPLAVIKRPWFSLGKYITLAFETTYNNSHIHPELNLIIDEDRSTTDEIFVELKYKSPADFYSKKGSEIISFDALDLISGEKNEIRITVKWKDIHGGESSETLSITRDSEVF